MKGCSAVLLLALACLLGMAATASAGCFKPLPTMLAGMFQADGQTTLTVKKGGSIIPKLCPGMTYDVHVQFPDARTYFVTVTKGFFQGLLPSISCPNMMTNNNSGTATTLDLQFSLSCAISGSAVLSVASLAPSATLYKWFNFTLPVLPLASCPGSSCLTASVSTGVVRLLPAYGQCGGAGGNCQDYYCDDKPYPGYQCISGWSCQRQHRWYYQCLPGTSSSTNGTAVVGSGSVSAGAGSGSLSLSFFGLPMADKLAALGVLCDKGNFSLNTFKMPKLIDPLAMLQIFAGLATWKNTSAPLDPFSMLITMKQLCGLVPVGNSTESVLVGGISKFLTVMTDKVLPSCNDTSIPSAAVDVLAALGTAASLGGMTDLSSAFSLSGMLSVITSFGKLLTLVKLFKLL